MNEKIPLRALAEEISRRSGCDIDVAQSYIKTLFAIVADRLLNGETVTINGLGTFAPIPNPDEPLRFAVDNDLASELNAPFAMFKAVDFSGEIDLEQLDRITSSTVDDVDDAEMHNEPEADQPQADESENTSGRDDANDTGYTESEVTHEDAITTAHENDISSVIEGDVEHCESWSDKPIDIVDEAINSADTPTEIDESVEAKPTQMQAEYVTGDLNESDDTESADTIETSEDNDAYIVENSEIPEEDEEYVEYHYPTKSRFGIGFLLGLITGLVVGALCFVGYVLYFVETGTKLF